MATAGRTSCDWFRRTRAKPRRSGRASLFADQNRQFRPARPMLALKLAAVPAVHVPQLTLPRSTYRYSILAVQFAATAASTPAPTVPPTCVLVTLPTPHWVAPTSPTARPPVA